MKNYYYIIAILSLLLVAVFTVYFLGKSKNNLNVAPVEYLERPIETNIVSIEGLDMLSAKILKENRKLNVLGFFQSVRSLEETEFDGTLYSHRIDILGQDESPYTLWLSPIEYQELLDQVISKKIRSGDLTILKIENGIFTIDKAKN